MKKIETIELVIHLILSSEPVWANLANEIMEKDNITQEDLCSYLIKRLEKCNQ